MKLTTTPLRDMFITQPWNVNWVRPGAYGDGKTLKDVHKGIDLRAREPKEAMAVISGTCRIGSSGVGGKFVTIRNKELGLHIYYGHLSEQFVENGQHVEEGDVIAMTGNTGGGTMPYHLHFGIKEFTFKKDGSGPWFKAPRNMKGYSDPTKFYTQDFMRLPVDKKYGWKPGDKRMSELDWFKANAYFYWKVSKQRYTKRRLLFNIEMKALRYGFWDLRTILDPQMFDEWTMHHKPEHDKRLNEEKS